MNAVNVDGFAEQDALVAAARLITYWENQVKQELPVEAQILDCHAHLGRDLDGMRGEFDELLAYLDWVGACGCFVFCMNEHDRVPSFCAGNDRTLAFAAQAVDRLTPFARLDLDDDPATEAVRCFHKGARGIKLHPRAQNFSLDNPRLSEVFAVAAAHSAPILLHGGRGLPPVAGELGRLLEANPQIQLIIAHAGIADMADLARLCCGRPGVFFDTSVWSPIDLLQALHLFPPEQLLFGSDYPYGQLPSALLLFLRTARAAGLAEEAIRMILGANARGIMEGRRPSHPSDPCAPYAFAYPTVFARIYQYISMAVPLFWTDQRDSIGALDLAIGACVPTGREHGEALADIRSLLVAARAVWAAELEARTATDRYRLDRMLSRLLSVGATVAVTAALRPAAD